MRVSFRENNNIIEADYFNNLIDGRKGYKIITCLCDEDYFIKIFKDNLSSKFFKDEASNKYYIDFNGCCFIGKLKFKSLAKILKKIGYIEDINAYGIYSIEI